ncbi:YjhG/YagF family D-xylonate dehydratase [Alicyclobacillus fastidiosus]|uniref:YjhG/YagF family D-xylonate dehydratase n=1 Tax=Alicyclobacillus fastidiosus TaxID=392011 RepID=A0ABV5AD33_9BACL|nr:YjhG/YagF family D-xylonate dehydratase [Alicyclobacillus fastidiosus]WEH08800.1 YjhG/YagF family D-xylonate dehydratase [Alicyclobacillus fastidiosus]
MQADSISALLESSRDDLYDIPTAAKGPEGKLPLTPEMLKTWASGDLFGLTQSVGMGWEPSKVLGRHVLMLSTLGGVRDDEGAPIALGYHTGHWEIGLLLKAAAQEFRRLGAVPHAAYVSDPCDGRSQGTAGMFDSLPYRNDAAMVMRRLIRSLPTRKAVMGVATCDKGLPATMLALASLRELPGILVPGGVTLPAEDGEDAGKVQTIGARYAHGEISLEYASEVACKACATPGGGCQFLGTAATAQVVAEALGMALPHSALIPSGQPIWSELAVHSARALLRNLQLGFGVQDVLTDASLHNAMVLHAAFGGSTNLLLHIPAIAHAAKLHVPSVSDWQEINRSVPRLVSVLPNGPIPHPTVRAFLAGGVPEVMLHLRELGLLNTNVLTVTGHTLDDVLNWWAESERRYRVRKRLLEADGVDPDDVILDPDAACARGLTSTVTFPTGNLAPDGAVIKSTAIDPSVLDADGVYRHTGPAKVYTTERDAIAAIKAGDIQPGDVLVLIGRGPSGTGMEETYQLTSALKHLSFGKHVALVTDARFSGVSTGACIGHVGPEALAGGPVGKLRTGDLIQIVIDCKHLTGSVDFVGNASRRLTPEEGREILMARPPADGLAPDPDLPDDTRLWAALQSVSGGAWAGAVYDVDRIIEVIEAGKQALRGQTTDE